MVLTADHGSIPDPKVTGAFQIAPRRCRTASTRVRHRRRPDARSSQLIQPTQIFVNRPSSGRTAHTLEEISEWILRLTKGQTALPDRHRPAGQQTTRVPGGLPLQDHGHLPCLPEARA
jgi:hypothetical protein